MPIFTLVPALFAIFLGDSLLVFIYKNLGKDSISIELFIYTTAEGVFAWILGKLVDIWSRKGVLIIIHILTSICLFFLYLNENALENYYYLALIASVIFIPSPAARSYIIDQYRSNIFNYKYLQLTTTRLIGISWIFQYLPWVFFIFLSYLSKKTYIALMIVGLLLNLTFIFFLFKDKHRESTVNLDESELIQFSELKNILLAFLFGQSVFFIAFSKSAFILKNSELFTLIGIGTMLGTIFSLFYRKIPHLSVITNSYGIGFLISLTGILVLAFTPSYESISSFVIPQIVHIGTIGGFYLPFVYDVVISRGRSRHRGRMLAYLEITQLIASLIGISFVSFFDGDVILLFSITSLFFLISIFFQLIEENRNKKDKKKIV